MTPITGEPTVEKGHPMTESIIEKLHQVKEALEEHSIECLCPGAEDYEPGCCRSCRNKEAIYTLSEIESALTRMALPKVDREKRNIISINEVPLRANRTQLEIVCTPETATAIKQALTEGVGV